MHDIEFLKSDLEMTKVVASSNLDIWKETMIERINHLLIIPCEADLINIGITNNYGCIHRIELSIGFWNHEEERIDFGSDILITYSKEEGLRFNHGTMGFFSVSDIYQIKRFRFFGYIAEHLFELETILEWGMENASTYISYSNQIKNIERIIFDIEKDQEKAEKSKIESKLIAGTPIKILHSRDWHVHFNESYYRDTDEYVIEKVNPKNVKVRVTTPESYVAQIKKTTLIDLIYGGRIIFE